MDDWKDMRFDRRFKLRTRGGDVLDEMINWGQVGGGGKGVMGAAA